MNALTVTVYATGALANQARWNYRYSIGRHFLIRSLHL